MKRLEDAVCGCIRTCWPCVGLVSGFGAGGLVGCAVGFVISFSLGVLVGICVGFTFGIIVALIAGEVTNGKNNHQPKKTKQEKEDEEWLAWIMATQAPPPPEF